MRLKGIPVILFLVLLFPGCASATGVFHTVGNGETLWRICHTYEVPMDEVVRVNDIKDPTSIKTGSRLFIPGAKNVLIVTPHHTLASLEGEAGNVSYVTKSLAWPVRGQVTSAFGIRDGVRHNGIDISVPEGTPIKAAESGRVVYVEDSMRGYGNIIIVKHDDDFYTLYAHNRQNFVRLGDDIARGEVIGTVGSSGNATGVVLHFEVRRGKNTLDPLFFLP